MKKIFFMVLVLIVFLSLFFLRVPIIQELSPKVAKHYGVDISNFEVSQIDIDKIVIPKLVMQHVDEFLQADIEIRDLVVDIDKYKAEVIAASSSYIHIDAASLSVQDSSSSKKSIKDLIKSLPVFGIDIEHLKLDYRTYEGEAIYFDGLLAYAQDATLKGELGHESGFNAELNFSIDESNFIFDLQRADASVVAVNGDFEIRDDWLSAHLKGDVSFSEINKFLFVFGIEQYVQEDESVVSADVELDLTRSAQNYIQSFAADVDIDSSLDISSKQIGVERALVDVSTSCRVKSLEFASCVLKNPQRVVAEFYQAPDWMREYFGRQAREYIAEINPSDQMEVQLSLKEVLAVKVKGNAAINVSTQSPYLKLNTWLSDLSFNGVYQDWQLVADYRLKLDGRDISMPYGASRLLAEGKGRIDADNKQMNVYVSEEFMANALQVKFEGFETEKIQLKAVKPVQFQFRYEDGYLKAKNMRFDLSSNKLRNVDVAIESAPLKLYIEDLAFSNNHQRIVANAQVENISMIERSIPVTAYKLNADIDFNNNKLSVEGSVNLGEQNHSLDFLGKHNVSTGLGSGEIKANAIALANNEIISNQIGDSGFPLQLKGGELDVDIAAIWNANNSVFEVTSKMRAYHVKGDYAQNQFSDLNTELEFVGQKGWKLKQPADIEIDIVNVGVPLRNVSMRLERMEYQVQEQPLVQVSDLYASALDGSIYTKKIEVDLNRRENAFSIFLSSLSLEKLIALNQTEDLVASGTLNGELPMRLDEGVLLIDGGWLQADENGGYIKYGRIGEILVGNENLQMVGELLEDFQYNEMSAQVNLVSGGELTLATKLHGRSPNASLNKQVNLNFNIDFNLWKFLESARLLTQIDRDISEQILSNEKR